MQIIKKIVRVGNSAGVILPKEWYGGEAKIEIVKKPLSIKQDILKILEPYLASISGIYLVGSYARGEQTKDSDVDVIVISEDIRKEISYGKYNISIYPVENIMKTLKENPIMIYPRLVEGDAIFNRPLLEQLRCIKISKNQFINFINETKNIIKINKEFIELDKLDGEVLESESVVYSMILRLRAMFLIKTILSEKIYSKRLFKEWLISEIGNKEGVEKIYSIYENIRDSKKVKIKIEIFLAEKFLNLLEKEVRRYAK